MRTCGGCGAKNATGRERAIADSKTTTEIAVRQLKAYAKYMYDNAEGIIGNVDKPNYVTEGGIRVSFTLMEHDVVPTLNVDMDYIVLDALGGD